MTERFTYLGVVQGIEESRIIWESNHDLTADDVRERENELSKKHGEKMTITSLSLISRRTVEQDEYPDSSKYVVRNVDSGEQFFYDYRHEAVEEYEKIVKEHGKWQEVELIVRIRHHAPPEVAT